MKSEDIGNFTLLARTAFAIMCFEKYVSSVYSHVDFKPVAEMMWHIVDGSDYLDEAAYKYAEIIPDSLFEYDSFESLDYQYMTKEQYVLFSNILNPQDRDLNLWCEPHFAASLHQFLKPHALECEEAEREERHDGNNHEPRQDICGDAPVTDHANRHTDQNRPGNREKLSGRQSENEF